uniref:Putative secreted peptide n=1 Tax=Anopheles braziliensis TaxID=58242 RepID=A0A2M3ZXR7_9DIPT
MEGCSFRPSRLFEFATVLAALAAPSSITSDFSGELSEGEFVLDLVARPLTAFRAEFLVAGRRVLLGIMFITQFHT